MDEFTLRKKMQAKGLSIVEGDTESRLASMREVLKMTLGAKTQADSYFHRKVIGWLKGKIEASPDCERELLRRIIDYAIEASGPSIRKPNALFMNIIKKELDYPK